MVGALVGERPSCTGTITFIPPSVEHGEVDHTVHECLFARCAGGFEGAGGGVHPDVDTAHEAARQLHVVVVEEDDFTDELGAHRDVVNLLDKTLPGPIGGVSLSGEEELDGIVGVVDNLGQTVEVRKEEVGTLIGGKTAGETDDKRVGVDFVEERHDASRVALVLEPIVAEAVADVVDELLLEGNAGFPHFLIRHLVDVFPQALVALVLEEVGAEVLLVDGLPLAGTPRRVVHTVGDVTHVALFGVDVVDLLVLVVGEDLVVARSFIGHIAGPDGLEHHLRHLTMQPAHAVDFLTGLAEESGHAEAFALVGGVLTTKPHEVIPADAEFLRILAEVLAAEGFIEVVVAGRYRSMHGVEGTGADEFEGLIEVETTSHEVGQTLHIAERSVTFVAVVHVLLNAEFLQGEDTTDTEEILLLHAVFPVTAIEAVCDAAVELRVHIVVRVEQVEGHTPHIDAPDEGVDGEGGERHVHHDLVAVGIEHALNGHAVEVLRFVVGNLLSVHRKRLGEVAVTVEETDGTHVHVGVGGFLDIVAGEHAETTGVNLHVVVHAVFHAEVGHRGTFGIGLFVHVGTESLVDLVHAGQYFLVGRHFFQAGIGDAAEQFYGVLVDFLPELGVQASEEVERFLIPAEPKVVRNFIERFQRNGDVAFHGHCLPRGLIGVSDFNVHGVVDMML